jgi:hypothetical protein
VHAAAAGMAELYLGFPPAAQEPPKVLRGFKLVRLEAGASAQVTIPLRQRDLSIWDVAAHSWRVPTGKFTAMVGASSCDIRLNATLSC